ncbi:MAG: RNase adapter RapZ [Clostridiales Family XIII bacterium]|jgi:UPF0042 nucleotide-binding protein|nr:RNase adapter RapZ [Clostridiales Family XIII bacterium]
MELKEIVVITGLSGAGKSLAVNLFEDMGYYCIDNLPPVLIKEFVKLIKSGKHKMDKVAFVIDIRATDFLSDFFDSLKRLKSKHMRFRIIYLEAPNDVLLKRFSETRRTHPLAEGRTNEEAIEEERLRLAPIKAVADIIIDTGQMNNAQLGAAIREFMGTKADEKHFKIVVQSFGYKKGMPSEADFIFDMRFIPNPFYVENLRNLNGNDREVRDYVMSFEESKYFADEVISMVERLKPSFIREGKANLNLAFGCTGGQHRSVTMANVVYEILTGRGEKVVLRHREISSGN